MLQILSLLCNAFLNILPDTSIHHDGQYLNFEYIKSTYEVKLMCLLHYFTECMKRLQIDETWTGTLLSITRRHLSESDLLTSNQWMTCQEPLQPMIILNQGSIEGAEGCLQADFANV